MKFNRTTIVNKRGTMNEESYKKNSFNVVAYICFISKCKYSRCRKL